MKNVKIVAIALVLIVACKCNNEQTPPGAGDTILVIPDTLLAFEVDTEAKTFKRYTEVPDSAFTAQRIVNGLNDKYPNVQIQLLKQSNDTLFISVPNSEFLAERMGSTGAGSWFQDVVLNLTSPPSIQYVNIDMQPGSHAMPGTFKKNALIKQYKEVKDSIPAV